ncbi:MAG: LamG-like jellyroll fold domain-containing protein [Verrucomicrobiota bacterium]
MNSKIKSVCFPIEQIAFALGLLLLCIVPIRARATLNPDTPAPKIFVDPADGALTLPALATEFATDGNLEGWISSGVTQLAVSSGQFRGISSSTTPELKLSIASNRPDLDLGFNDYLEIGLQLPSNYTGDVRMSYRCSNAPGLTEFQTVTIPNTILLKDGKLHTYRLDLGLEVWWRGNLQDLILQPVTVGDTAFAIDFVRVGDLPNDPYFPNTTDQPVTAYELSSKHFRFIWDAKRASANGIDATKARGCLRNAEEVWQVYVKLLGYREPAESVTPGNRDGKKYKVNFLCIYDGFWMGGSPTGFGYLNIEPGGLEVDPPTWVTPHEGMHVFQMHNTSGHMQGEWWEGHANYGRERWLYHFQALYPNTSNLEAGYPRNAHLNVAHGRDYYLSWPFFLYLDENPDDLPDLGEGTMVKIWQNVAQYEYAYQTIARLAPQTPLKDIVGFFARRGVTYNYSHQALLRNTLNRQDPATTARFQFTGLLRRSDAPDWWRVPMTMAPMQGAYTTHELLPEGTGNGRVVTVNLHGLPDASRGADLRAGFVVLNDNGSERYSSLWNSGPNSITLSASENKLYLVVAGTPDSFVYGSQKDSEAPYRSHPSKTRFHYELQITGAAPKEPAALENEDLSGLIKHPNGGGYKSPNATVDATAYIGPDARVLDSAKVQGLARVEDFAVVRDAAQVQANAVVSGHALIRGNAQVRENAKVRDWAIVEGGATISGNGRVLEHADISGGTVTDYATAKGCAIAWGNPGADTVGGHGMIDGDYMSGRNVSAGIGFGHLPYVGVPDECVYPVPSRLFASYEFDHPHDSLARDTYGVTDAFLQGAPAWVAGDDTRMGFLRLNGSSQYISLERAVGDFKEFTFSVWIKPDGGTANQPVFYYGTSANNRCSLVANADGNHVKFFVSKDGADQTLTSTGTIANNQWAHLTVTLTGSRCNLYLNGQLAASAPSSITPDQLLGPNTDFGVTHAYLGRGETSAFFSGAMDGVRFYSTALSPGEITRLYQSGSDPTAEALMARYPFNEGAGTVVHDTSSGGATVVLSGSAGWGNGGLELNGVDNVIETAIPNGSARTLSAWIFPRSSHDVGGAIESVFDCDVPGQYGSGWGLNNGKIRVILDDQFWDTNVPAELNQWQHIALSFDSTEARLYVNGERKATLAYSQGGVTLQNYKIGRSNASGSAFHGTIREASIYSRAVNDLEILKIYKTASLSRRLAPFRKAPLKFNVLEGLPNVGWEVVGTSNPLHGTVSSQTNGEVLYTPAIDFKGQQSDRFLVTLKNVTGDTLLIHVDINGQAAIQGVYQALLENPAAEATGRLTLQLNASGSFSGKVETKEASGAIFTFVGGFLADLVYRKDFKTRQNQPAQLRVKLDPVNLLVFAEFDFNGVTNRASIGGSKFQAKRNPAPQAGNYTLRFTPVQNGTSAPNVPGYATLSVSDNGATLWNGKLSDGAVINGSAYIGTDAFIPFYQILYPSLQPASIGALLGPIRVDPQGENKGPITGSLSWTKPARPGTPFWPDGFELTNDVSGSIYNVPGTKNTVIPTLNSSDLLNFNRMTPGAGTLSISHVHLSLSNRFTVDLPNPEKIAISLSRSSGIVIGLFWDGAAHKSRKLYGVVLQNEGKIEGFSLGDHDTGSWSLNAH